MPDSWIELSIDLETYSEENLKTCGLYKYALHPSFEIMLFAYSYTTYYYDDENKLRYKDTPTECLDLMSGDVIPARILRDMVDPRIIKTAHNVPFELLCLTVHLKRYYPEYKLDGRQWVDTMVKAAMLGLPLGLDHLGMAMNLSTKKDREGTALIQVFCVPNKPPKAKKGQPVPTDWRRRVLPEHEPEKWRRFIQYCIKDVDVEKLAKHRMAWFQIPDSERELWSLDQEINARGVRIDTDLAERAIEWDGIFKKRTLNEMIKLTGLQNPNSVKQLKEWLAEAIDEDDENYDFDEKEDKLDKDAIPKIIAHLDSERIKRVLQLRLWYAKTSIRKYKKMLQMCGHGDRIRGCIQFCGAGRTWRWAGRGIQPHNFPRNIMEELDLAREVVLHGKMSTVDIFDQALPDILSQLLRTAFIPKPGHCFYVSDYAAIEARVLAWLAGEQWVLDVFNGHGKIYEATASKMFNVPLESIDKKSPWRQRGKVADLACGYQGGVGALLKMKALDFGIKESELPELVKAWRAAHPATVKFWKDIHEAVKQVLTDGGKVVLQKGIVVAKKRGHLFIKLPSGRELVYVGAYYDWEDKQIKYWGLNQESKKWERLKSYGGKFVENIVQAVARDILKEGMLSVRKKYDIVLHIHDEIISEAPEGYGSIEEHNRLMCPTIPWAAGLPLKSAGFKGYYYMKD